MCGIFGYVGKRDDAAQIVLAGLKKLEYRGYDSWGVAVSQDAHAVLDRHVGKIGEAVTALPASPIGLGHTRWATHGAVTDDNAHPQLDCTGRLALVHNGIVANEADLRQALARAGHQIRSQTDSELIAHLIEDLLERMPAGPERLIQATMAAFRKLRGLNAIAVLDVRSGEVAAAKSGSPLVLGVAEWGHFLASDHSALLEHTRDVAFIHDGQAVSIQRERARLFEIDSGHERVPELTHVEWDAESVDRNGHADYMTKEIHEQPRLLRALAQRAGTQVERLAERIERAADVILVGCGSAWHAALAGQYLFARVAGLRVASVSGSEFALLSPFVGPHTLVLALSQSGETIDILEAVRAARSRGGQIAALTNVEGSTLWRLADFTLPLGAGPERCVLSTKTLTAKLAILLMTAYALKGQLGRAVEALQVAADDLEDMLAAERRATILEIASAIHACGQLFVLGRGPSFPLALESALKIKEVSYIHAEGFASGDLKHGVMALIEPGTPCIVLAPRDDCQADVMAGALQAKARGARLIGVSPDRHSAFDFHIPVADVGEATLVLNAAPAQLLGYDFARLRGCDPDMPRNLAKSVTVK